MTERHVRAAQASANRSLVEHFYEMAYDLRDVPSAALCLHERFVHHEPDVEAGKDAFLAFLAEELGHRPNLQVARVRTLSDGAFMLVHSRRQTTEDIAAFIEILRVEDARIAEYWRVLQSVPDVIANPNGMF